MKNFFESYPRNFLKLCFVILLAETSFWGINVILWFQLKELSFAEKDIQTWYNVYRYPMFFYVIGGLAGFFLFRKRLGNYALLAFGIGALLLAAASITKVQELLIAGILVAAAAKTIFKPWVITYLANSFEPKFSSRIPDAILMSILFLNIGAFIAPIAMGTLGQRIHFGVAFALAAVLALWASRLLILSTDKEASIGPPLAGLTKYLPLLILVMIAAEYFAVDRSFPDTDFLSKILFDAGPLFLGGVLAPFVWVFLSSKGAHIVKAMAICIVIAIVTLILKRIDDINAYIGIATDFSHLVSESALEALTMAIILTRFNFRWGLLMIGAYYSAAAIISQILEMLPQM